MSLLFVHDKTSLAVAQTFLSVSVGAGSVGTGSIGAGSIGAGFR